MDITHNLEIKASAKTIYDAVATEKGISSWWSKDCAVAETVGRNSTLNFDKQGTIVTMQFETQTLTPNTNVVWECTQNPNPAWIGTKINYVITENNGACSVVFSHSDFDEKWKGQEPFEMTKGGWEHFVASLVSYCEAGTGQPW